VTRGQKIAYVVLGGLVLTFGGRALFSYGTRKQMDEAGDDFDKIPPRPAVDIITLELNEARAARWFAESKFREDIIANDRRITEETHDRRVTKTKAGVMLAVVEGGKVLAIKAKP